MQQQLNAAESAHTERLQAENAHTERLQAETEELRRELQTLRPTARIAVQLAKQEYVLLQKATKRERQRGRDLASS